MHINQCMVMSYCSRRRPATSFLWITSPWKSFRYIVWKHWKWYIILGVVIILLVLVAALIVYTFPVSITVILCFLRSEFDNIIQTTCYMLYKILMQLISKIISHKPGPLSVTVVVAPSSQSNNQKSIKLQSNASAKQPIASEPDSSLSHTSRPPHATACSFHTYFHIIMCLICYMMH